MVFFTERALGDGRKAALREKILAVKHVLEDIRKDSSGGIRVKDVWFGEYNRVQAFDFSTSGRIKNDEAAEFPYVLLMRFDDRESLEAWYRLDLHSHLREQIYRLCDERFVELFDKIAAIRRENPNDVSIASTYEMDIEAHALEFLGRRDYCEADNIAEIVQRRPFRPKITF